MKFLLNTLLLLAFVSVSNQTLAQKWTNIKGSGNLSTETRNVGTFDGLDVGGSWNISLEKGTEGKVVITIDDNLMEHVITEVKNGTLRIKADKNFNKITKAEMTIYYNDINSLDLSGASNVTANDMIKARNLSIDCSGASKVEISQIDAGTLVADFSGASSLELGGVADQFNVDVSGATSVDAYGLKVKNSNIDASGASSVKLNVSGQLSVEASGASSVKYRGTPSVSKDVSGAASVRGSSK